MVVESPSLADFQVLLAAAGQLSGDGQLRELMRERLAWTCRQATGACAGCWFLPPALVAELGLGQGKEAVVSQDPAVHVWLQLRFGGSSVDLGPSGLFNRAWLDAQARELPPPATPPQLTAT